jgi:hypothetical protein
VKRWFGTGRGAFTTTVVIPGGEGFRWLQAQRHPRATASPLSLEVRAPARLEGWAKRQHPSRLAEERRAPPERVQLRSSGDDAVLVAGPFMTPDGQIRLTCPAPFAKTFRFTFDPTHLFILNHPGPIQRGVSRSSRTLGWDAMDADGAADESASSADGEVVWS